MKKFISVFCSVLALSSTGVYAGTLQTTPANIKGSAVICIKTKPLEKCYYINLNKPSNNQNNCTQSTTVQTICSVNSTTVEQTTNVSTETTTEATTETTTQITTEATTETTTQITTEATTVNNNLQTTETTTISSPQLSIAQEVLNLVNAERAKQNLSALKLNTKLSEVAQLKSEDMKNKNYFSHTSPTYGSPFNMMKQFGISYKYAGENIAKGQKTAKDVVNAWMNSEGHRANILNKNFTDMGLGYVKSGSTTYWTQMFIQK